MDRRISVFTTHRSTGSCLGTLCSSLGEMWRGEEIEGSRNALYDLKQRDNSVSAQAMIQQVRLFFLYIHILRSRDSSRSPGVVDLNHNVIIALADRTAADRS